MKTILVDAWNTFVTKDGIYQPIHDLLEQYPNPKIIVTNANEEQLVKLGIVNMPYIVYTMMHNPDKDDPKYFETLMSDHNLKASKLVYFEHNPDAVASAQSLGITAYHYDHTVQDITALKHFLDEALLR